MPLILMFSASQEFRRFPSLGCLDSMARSPCSGLIRPDWSLHLFVASSRCCSGLADLVITSTTFRPGFDCG
ncbi:hypothetical protein TNCV_3824671 [Trichonephila clavipes]|nr:hypothetical protein TNCV_3824671 [Trichonephila clavipes]